MKSVIKSLFKIIFVFLFIIFFLITFSLVKYFYIQSTNYSMIDTCKKSKFTSFSYKTVNDYANKYPCDQDCQKILPDFLSKIKEYKDENDCYQKMYSLLLPYLLIYKVELKNNVPLEFYRIDDATTYYVPDFVTNSSDAMISYGIGSSCSFEDNYNSFFNKPVYCFDCGNTKNICQKSYFEQECIVTKENNTNKSAMRGNGGYHIFEDKMKQLNLEDKHIYLKINIGKSSDIVIDDILKYHDNIDAISLVIDLIDMDGLVGSRKTLKKLEKYFVPVTRTSLKGLKDLEPLIIETNYFKPKQYTSGWLGNRLLITYINKNMIDKYYLPFNQQNSVEYKKFVVLNMGVNFDKYSNISPVVVLAKKLKNRYGIDYE